MLQDENDLKLLLIEKLSTDFELIPEVFGLHPIIRDKKMKIDFIARPKSHIIDQDFIDEWFGIEVKYISDTRIGRQLNKVFWQAITYAQSTFNIGKPPSLEKERPCFVFVFINTRAIITEHQERLSNLVSFCQYGNVGQLLLYANGYSFEFGGGIYFRKRNDIIHRGKNNVGVNHFAGNSAVSIKNVRM